MKMLRFLAVCLGDPIHHARNPVSISDSTHDRTAKLAVVSAFSVPTRLRRVAVFKNAI